MRYAGLAPFPGIGNPDFLRLVSDDFLREQIRQGRPGRRMPAWGEQEGGLRDEEIARELTRSFLAYLGVREPF